MTNTPLNPDALEAAAKATYDFRNEDYDEQYHDLTYGDKEYEWLSPARVAVSAYLAAAQPEVNSVEELDKLPMHSYVQGNDGFKHAKDWNGGWHLIVNRPSSAPHLSGSIELPARVLYRPEVK